MKPIKAWAWAIKDTKGKWVLCYWAHHNREEMIRDRKPSTEAKLVRVEIRELKPRKRKQGR